MLDESFREALSRGYSFIAHNVAYNDAWGGLHTMTPGVGERMGLLASEPAPAVLQDMFGFAKSWGLRARGDLRGALDSLERAQAASTTSTNEKVRWRNKVELAEVLLELGRLDEAAATLAPPAERAERQG